MTETPAARATAHRHPRYVAGVIMVALSGMCLSFVGLTLRHIETDDGWQILFYRSLAFSVIVGLFALYRRGGRVRGWVTDVGWPGFALALVLAAGFICYVFAMLLTTVAMAAFILSTGPFFAAILGWLILGERVRPATWAAIAAVILGIGLMMGEGISSGTWLGALVALGIPISYALIIVIIRRAEHVDMLPATAFAGIFAAAACGLLMDGFAVAPRDFLLMTGMGAGQVGMAFIFLTVGARYVPAAEVAVIGLTETIFAPVWVWLWVGETPAPLTLAGGAVVLGAVLFQAVRGLKGEAKVRVPDYADGTG